MRIRELREAIQELETRKRLPSFRRMRDRFEAAIVDHAVRRCGGDKEEAAKKLGISHSSVKEKCQRGFGGRR